MRSARPVTLLLLLVLAVGINYVDRGSDSERLGETRTTASGRDVDTSRSSETAASHRS